MLIVFRSSDRVQKTQIKKAAGSKKVKGTAANDDSEESEGIAKKKAGGKKGKKVEVVKEAEDTEDNIEPSEAADYVKNESDESIEFEELA